MAPRIGVIGRDAHQAVYADLGLKIAVGIIAGHQYGGAFDAGLFSLKLVDERGFKTAALGPSQIHPHEHACPVLRFGAAGAGMNAQESIALIAFAAEHFFEFQILHRALKLIGRDMHLSLKVVILFGLARKLQQHRAVFRFFLQAAPCGKAGLDHLALAVYFLRFPGILPEIRIGAYCFKLFHAGLFAGEVKDNLGWFPCVFQVLLFFLSTG